jgi:hypothetical protein
VITDLPARLYQHAAGLTYQQAAVGLLCGHRHWLERPDFAGSCVGTGDPPSAAAWIEWTGALTALDAGELPCSGGEARILRLAAGLAEGHLLDLREVLVGLDLANTDLVVEAVYRTTGHRRPQEGARTR